MSTIGNTVAIAVLIDRSTEKIETAKSALVCSAAWGEAIGILGVLAGFGALDHSRTVELADKFDALYRAKLAALVKAKAIL